MTGTVTSNILGELKDEISLHPMLSSRLVEFIKNATPLKHETARAFALMYYPHILRTRLYQANALGITPDENIQFVLSDILYDEYGNGKASRSHMAIYRKFLHALELHDDAIDSAPIIPELQMYIDSMMRLTQGEDWLAAIAAVGIASEWPIPELYTAFVKGFRTIPGITDDDLELFISHIELDLEHSRMMENAITPYLHEATSLSSIKRGIQLNLDARVVMMDGIYHRLQDSA